MGEWISFAADGTVAKGVYLEVASTIENMHGPVIYELQAHGAQPPKPAKRKPIPTELVIPLGGEAAEEFFVLGNVGDGFDPQAKAARSWVSTSSRTSRVSRRRFPWRSARTWRTCDMDIRPRGGVRLRAAGPTSAGLEGSDRAVLPPRRTGAHRAQEAVADVRPPATASRPVAGEHHAPGDGSRHGPVPGRTDAPAIRPADERFGLSGEGRQAIPGRYAEGRPVAAGGAEDPSREISLDGPWLLKTDPGNLGIRQAFFAPDHDTSGWQPMPVPSQWYVQGLDYHGVVWFRRISTSRRHLPATSSRFALAAWITTPGCGSTDNTWAGISGPTLRLSWTPRRRSVRGAKNILVVRVDSPIDPGFTGQKTLLKGNAMDDIAMPYGEEGCMGGIYRPVTLRGRGNVGLEEVWTQSTVSPDLARADVTVRFVLQARQPKPEELSVRYRLTQADGRTVHDAESRCAMQPTGSNAGGVEDPDRAAEALVPLGTRGTVPIHPGDRSPSRRPGARSTCVPRWDSRGDVRRQIALPACEPPPHFPQGDAQR